MSNKIIQRIRIDGKNWNDIISLPCVQSLDKGDERLLRMRASALLMSNSMTAICPKSTDLKACRHLRKTWRDWMIQNRLCGKESKPCMDILAMS